MTLTTQNTDTKDTASPATLPLYVGDFYMIPQGAKTFFSSRKVTVYVHPGRLRAVRQDNNQVMHSYTLYNDVKFIRLGGQLNISYMNNKKAGAFDRSYVFNTADPRLMLLTYLYVLFGGRETKALKSAIEQAATTVPKMKP